MRRRCFSQAWVQWTHAMVLACIGLTAAARTTGADPKSADLDLSPADLKSPVRLWEPSLHLSAGGGFKDNVALSHAAPEASAFFRSGLELGVSRLALDGTQVILFVNAEDTRYFSSETVDHEDTAFGQAEVRQFLGNRWQVALALEGAYLDQVIDLSVTETNRTPLLVRGALILARPGVRYEFARGWWTALELPASRQYYEETLDDYWQLGPKASLGHSYGHKSELALSYEFTQRSYDAEPARAEDGSALTNLTRASSQHEVTLGWRHHWDPRQRWRTLTRVGFRQLFDNASGYFDYRRVQVSEQIRYRTTRWQITAEVRLGFYEFPVQTIAGPGTDPRDRTDLTLQVRGEYQLARHLRLYAQYEREETLSNLTLDEYTVNTFSGGLTLEF